MITGFLRVSLQIIPVKYRKTAKNFRYKNTILKLLYILFFVARLKQPYFQPPGDFWVRESMISLLPNLLDYHSEPSLASNYKAINNCK